jgi:hypothetical protein
MSPTRFFFALLIQRYKLWMPNVVEMPQSGSLIYRLPQQFHAIETNVDTEKPYVKTNCWIL